MVWVAFIEVKARLGRNADGTIGAFTYAVVEEHSRKRAAIRMRLAFRGDNFFVVDFDEFMPYEQFEDPSDMITAMAEEAKKTGQVITDELTGFEFDYKEEAAGTWSELV
ncbi:MAG: hypothetical protein H7308_18510 [Chthonomonadaceae bacterium]|nr:hypothetical protein [Chthonomonadaceae bacterium]